jgi:hypothetical protein
MKNPGPCLTLLLFLAGSAGFTENLATLPIALAGDGHQRFTGRAGGSKLKDGFEKSLKSEPSKDRDRPCRSDEIGRYLLQHNIRPSPSQMQARPPRPGEVRVIYLMPSDREPRPEFIIALANGMKHLQRFYLDQLNNGQTFQLQDPIVEVKSSSHETSWFSTNPASDNSALNLWFNSINDASAQFFDPDYIYVIYVDVHAPGQATGGGGGIALLPQEDILGMIGQSTSNPNVCRWVGGLGHELGHAFGLPHPPECDSHQSPDSSFPCQSLMYLGYLTYPETYLLHENVTDLYESPFMAWLLLEEPPCYCSNLLCCNGP